MFSKKKQKPAKKMKPCTDGECQHEVPKRVDEAKKITTKEVFGARAASVKPPVRPKVAKKKPAKIVKKKGGRLKAETSTSY